LKTRFVCFTVLLCVIFPLAAADFGLTLDQSAELQGYRDNTFFTYTGALIPWFSALPAPGWDVLVSAGFTVKREGEAWDYIPEIRRTRLVYHFGGGEVRAGRMEYSDPLGLSASGLFDGLALSLGAGDANVSAGVWYTGLLYKKSAVITVTAEDLIDYYAPFEYARFTDTYFASRRLLAAADFEHPALAGLLRLRLSASGQIVLNGRETAFHSQYLTGKIALPVKAFVFDLGGSAELEEDAGRLGLGLLGEMGISWTPPTAVHDRLSLRGRFSSGRTPDGLFAAFVPLTSAAHGNILKANISGLQVIHAEYTARPHRTFSYSLEGFYFIRSDLGSYRDWPVREAGYFLGGEFDGRLIWSPVSDLKIEFGGGVFAPAMGNTDPRGASRWKLELGAVFALY
jgi:hypothetical protein